MTGVFKELVFGLGRGFGIYFSQRNEFIDSGHDAGPPLEEAPLSGCSELLLFRYEACPAVILP